MQELNVQGKLLLGALLVLAIAAPVACSSDDSSNKGGAAGTAGEAGSPESAGTGGSTAQGGKGGAGGKAGTGGSTAGGTAGSTGVAGSAAAGEGGVANSGGTDTGGAPAMGGEAGMTGEAGATGTNADAEYKANLDATCTTQAALDCSDRAMPASDKQDCLDTVAGGIDFAPACADAIKANVACLAPLPGSSFTCNMGAAFQNADVCADTNNAVNDCFLAQQ